MLTWSVQLTICFESKVCALRELEKQRVIFIFFSFHLFVFLVPLDFKRKFFSFYVSDWFTFMILEFLIYILYMKPFALQELVFVTFVEV